MFFCVTGADGAGKSTVISSLSERWRAQGRQVRVASIWDLIRLESKNFPLKPEQIDSYLACLSSSSRSYFLLHCLSESFLRARDSNAEIVLFDSYWYKYIASELAREPESENDPRLQAALALAIPDRTVLLEVDAKAAQSRKTKLSGYESDFASESNARSKFEELNEKTGAILSDWADRWSWSKVSAMDSPETVFENVWRAFQVPQ